MTLNGATAWTTSFTVERKAGLLIETVLLWMRTISVKGDDCLNPASLRSWSAWCDWPTFASCWSMFLVPTILPITSAATTKISQPKTAVFQ